MMGVAAPVQSQSVMSGDIVQLMKTIKEAMPDMGSNKFFVPTNAHLNFFQQIFLDLAAGKMTTIESRASQYGYEFIRYINIATNDTLYVLKETIPVLRGWGTYVYNPKSANDLAIEAPHPLWDTNTWEVAIRTYLKTHAKWFLLAGTHRYANSDNSSDMAHVTQSVFYTCHTTIATSRAVQIHGFSKSGANAGYPDVVISNGTMNPPAILFTLKANYEAKGFTAGVFSLSTYAQLSNLGATTNAQGQWSANNGKLFVHIEHDYPLRTTESKEVLVIDAINETFGSQTSAIAAPTPPHVLCQLFPNYPNPFNPVTTIQFSLPSRDRVRLSVFDAAGREIAVLADGCREAGVNTLPFDAGRFASGTYFCKLQTSSYSRTMNMVLLK
ncbi:MAG: T9SS type A sorting domain-containing protein [Ignavibacteriales bacterium]|nr:T9SS type A sorting domain-containing protein [Ignavibacteriales bacterium]